MIRKLIAAVTGIVVSTLVLGCASAPPSEAPPAAAAPEPAASASVAEVAAAEPGAAKAEAQAEETVVVQTTEQAKKYATEEEIKRARRECMRKMRRITGSRIPRNACQGSTGLYSGAYNQQQEGLSRGVPGGGGPPQ